MQGLRCVVFVWPLLSACATVPTGYAGVVLRSDGVQAAPLGEGVTFVGPLARTDLIDMRTIERSENLLGVASDGAPVQANASVVTWQVAPGEAVAFDRSVGPAPYDELIRPVVQAAVRRVVARYSAPELMDTRNIPTMERAITELSIAQLRPLHIELDAVVIRSVTVVSRPMNLEILSTGELEQQVEAIPQRLALARARVQQRLEQARAVAAANQAVGATLGPNTLADLEAHAWSNLLAAAGVSVVVQGQPPLSLEVEP